MLTLRWLIKFFGLILLLTGSLSIADSLRANPSDPNLSQFLPSDQKQTQGEYCARCVEEALETSRFSNSVIPSVREAIRKMTEEDRRSPQGPINRLPPALSPNSSDPGNRFFVNLDTDQFNRETARLLAEKISANSASIGSSITIIYRQELADQKQAILRQVREAIRSQLPAGDSGVDGTLTTDSQGNINLLPGNFVQIRGRKVALQMYSAEDVSTSAKVHVVGDDGRPKMVGSYSHSIDRLTQINVSSGLAKGASTISIQYKMQFY